MKPRERKPQAQKTRLYARKNDHRDILYYDETIQKCIYHNALYWAEEDQTEIKKENVAWVKYPKDALLVSSQYHRIGWIDVNRQFSYGIADRSSQNWMSQMIQLDDITVVWQYLDSNSTYIMVTEDGIVWQHIPWSGGTVVKGDPFNARKFGFDNTIVTLYADDWWHGGGDRKHIETWHFEKDEETEKWTLTYSQASIPEETITWSTELRYMGTKEDCIVVGKEVRSNSNNTYYWQLFVYELYADGSTVMLSDPVPELKLSPYFSNDNYQYRTCQVGSRLFYATITKYQPDTGSPIINLRACMSMNGGRTWNETVLFGYRADEQPTQGTVSKVDMCVRDDRVMVIFGQYYEKEGSGAKSLHIYDTFTGTSWDEVALPTWVDVPLLTDISGQGVTPASQETLRIAVRPEGTSNYDTTFFDMLPSNERGNVMNHGAGNVLYKDGKFDDDKEFFLHFGYGNGYHAFFDNRYLAENARSFAWIDIPYNSEMTTEQQADLLQRYDYCAPGAVTTETEENNG